MIISENIKDIRDLRIYQILEHYSTNMDIVSMGTLDITHLELDQKNWELVKGKRTERLYLIPETVLVCIRDKYEYEYSGWEITSYTRSIEYIDNDSNVGVTKQTQFVNTSGKITRLNRNIKANVIDDLRERGKNMSTLALNLEEPLKTFYNNIAASTDRLLNHYWDIIHRDCLDFTWQPWIAQINADLLDQYEIDGITEKQLYKDLTTVASADGTKNVSDFILAEITI